MEPAPIVGTELAYPRVEMIDDFRRIKSIDNTGAEREVLLCMSVGRNGRYCNSRAVDTDKYLCGYHMNGHKDIDDIDPVPNFDIIYPRVETWQDGLRRKLHLDSDGKEKVDILCTGHNKQGTHCINYAENIESGTCRGHKTGVLKDKIKRQIGAEWDEDGVRYRQTKGGRVKLCIGFGIECNSQVRTSTYCGACNKKYLATIL